MSKFFVVVVAFYSTAKLICRVKFNINKIYMPTSYFTLTKLLVKFKNILNQWLVSAFKWIAKDNTRLPLIFFANKIRIQFDGVVSNLNFFIFSLQKNEKKYLLHVEKQFRDTLISFRILINIRWAIFRKLAFLTFHKIQKNSVFSRLKRPMLLRLLDECFLESFRNQCWADVRTPRAPWHHMEKVFEHHFFCSQEEISYSPLPPPSLLFSSSKKKEEEGRWEWFFCSRRRFSSFCVFWERRRHKVPITTTKYCCVCVGLPRNLNVLTFSWMVRN